MPNNITTNNGQGVAIVSASYKGPSDDSFVVNRDIPLAAASSQAPGDETMSLAEKTKFLKDLRTSVAAVQDQVNKELTQRMEADKAREAGTATAITVNEAEEEQNYGEEVVDEDA
ncbi:hypothetical protein PpBr36_08086 [Pyricularia pennisetigena]|uniref:hypothetical protein n=1 Tax=Pyricularia pennisetigena TaxID=1578925 RepID=UPI00114F14AD|nr:hypothetical protein PpBr36_08086 [Pyricularia pennisetigena]TLS24555.1 hypothetical protein PpBr36_08086 [Pyricularia pennisetigena]